MKTTRRNHDPFTVDPVVAAKLADFASALDAAATKLNLAIDDFDADRAHFDEFVLGEAICTANLFGPMITSLFSPAAGTLRSEVFAGVVANENKKPSNSPHTEGVVLALRLALNAIQDAIDLSDPGDRWDDGFMMMVAAAAAVRSMHELFSSSITPFDEDEALKRIVARHAIAPPFFRRASREMLCIA